MGFICSIFCQIAFNIRIVQINMFSFSLFWQMGSKYCSRKYYLVASTELAAAILFAPCMNIANHLPNMAIENNTHYMHRMEQLLQVIWQIWQTICRIYYKHCTFHGKQFTLYAPYDAFTVHIVNYMAWISLFWNFSTIFATVLSIVNTILHPGKSNWCIGSARSH